MSVDNTWMLRGGRVFGPAPFGIMGIVNLTPDSFFDGGQHNGPEAALAHARLLLEQGADILDLGAESSRPGADPVSTEEEQARLLPVLAALAAQGENPPADAAGSCHAAPAPQLPLLSVDTYHAATAHAALQAGAHIINDISACTVDPALLDVLVQWKPGYVLMHSQGLPKTMQQAPQYEHVVDEVLAFLEQHMARLVKAGLPESHIVLDPGIGFGKRLEHNLSLLRGMDRIQALGRPVLMGLSMKSLFRDLFRDLFQDLLPGTTADAPPSPHSRRDRQEQEARSMGTQVATALLAARGVALHRVHHVAETRRTLALVQAFTL